MDTAVLTAVAGLAGAAIGGFTSFATSWLTLRAQMREKMRTATRARREKVYTDFIRESARLFGDALGHDRDDVSDLIALYALVAQMRLIAPASVIEKAEHVLRVIVNTYLGPNRTLHELPEFANQGGLDPLRHFSEVCRAELEHFDEARSG